MSTHTPSIKELIALAEKIEAWTPSDRAPLTLIAYERRMLASALRAVASALRDMAGTDTCPRVLTRGEMVAGLKAGRTYYVDRRDAPELIELQQLERDGLVTSRLIEIDEQSSVLQFKAKQA
jgi:hypothetical protein